MEAAFAPMKWGLAPSKIPSAMNRWRLMLPKLEKL